MIRAIALFIVLLGGCASELEPEDREVEGQEQAIGEYACDAFRSFTFYNIGRGASQFTPVQIAPSNMYRFFGRGPQGGTERYDLSSVQVDSVGRMKSFDVGIWRPITNGWRRFKHGDCYCNLDPICYLIDG